GRKQSMIRGHDNDEGKRHHRPKQKSAQKPQSAGAEQPGNHPSKKTDNCERGLHGGRTFITWGPYCRRNLSVTAHARWMLDEIDVDGSACEDRTTESCQEFYKGKHLTSSSFRRIWLLRVRSSLE